MAKRKQTRTKRNNIDTSLDTSPLEKDSIDDPNLSLFPSLLIGKKFKRVKSFLDIDDDWQYSIELYLEKKNPKHLFDAIRDNNSLLQGVGRNLKYEELGIDQEIFPSEYKKRSDKKISSKYVDAHTIVWTSIEWWQELIGWQADKDLSNIARDSLLRIGRALIPERKEWKKTKQSYGLYHLINMEKGTHPQFKYVSPHEFIQKWDEIYKIFREGLKSYYKSEIKPLIKKTSDQHIRRLALVHEMDKGSGNKLNDLKKIMKENFDDKISSEELRRFNVETVKEIIASYIAWKHEKDCIYCDGIISRKKTKPVKSKKLNKVGFKTILKLYNDAKAEIDKTNSA